MSENKAKILGSSTLGSEPISIEQPQEQQVSETAVNTNGELETQTVTQPETITTTEQTTTVEDQPQQEDNASKFELSFGEEATSTTPDNQPNETQSNQSWRDILKKLDKKEVAKELGFDDFDLEFSEARKRGVDPRNYINKAIDWAKVSDLDILRADYKNQFPDATPAQIDRLINKKFSQTDIAEEEDREDGMLMMRAEARRLREQKVNEQNSFKLPDVIQPEIDENYTKWKSNQEEVNKYQEWFKPYLTNHEATKELLQNKRVAIPIGKEGLEFNFNIEKPEALLTPLTDGGKTWNKLVRNEKGEPDVFKQQMLVLFAANPYKFIDDIFSFGKSQGVKAKVMEAPSGAPITGNPPRASVVSMTEKDAWKQNARSSTLGAQ